ncbi:hypothetical protein [Aquicella lusitana]|uniref:Uncharacterized protein n=1 Tax=Aquicella lusitana TaxID=254246 RepID=A0A370GRG9_9COXI|nr:hypothetical protein [Aquicella lusitana]RDI45999.1 hypothetical protein C8D86_1063 [Aquicella lusitana]VVC73404.1 hypothetical protein AQULUS_11430 [Aquicella lusitana]
MAKWRDIPSTNDWQTLCGVCTLPTDSAASALLDKITGQIASYHRLVKTDFGAVEERITQLIAIGQAAQNYLDLYARENDDPTNIKKSLSGSIDPWIRYLLNQSLKKARYLEAIKPFSQKYPSQKDLRAKLQARDVKRKMGKANKFLSLDGGTFLEREDPCHRDFEFRYNNMKLWTNPSSSLSNSLFFTYMQDSHESSFFLWLEDHPATVLTPAVSKDWDEIYRSKIKKIDYAPKDMITITVDKTAYQLVDTNASAPTPLETRKMKNLALKVGSPWGAAAFVWSKEDKNKFITHPHRAGKFHHSSLAKGKKVRCSGMWLVSNGKVLQINNSSGHYKPDSLQFYKLIRFLNKNHLLTEDTLIADMTRPPELKDENQLFAGVKSQYYRLAEYLKWAEELPDVKEYLAKKMEIPSSPIHE